MHKLVDARLAKLEAAHAVRHASDWLRIWRALREQYPDDVDARLAAEVRAGILTPERAVEVRRVWAATEETLRLCEDAGATESDSAEHGI